MKLQNGQELESQKILPRLWDVLAGRYFSTENSICAPSFPSLKLAGGLLNHHPENSAGLPLSSWTALLL